MTSSDVGRSGPTAASTTVRTPLWVIGLSALLIAGGFGPRSSQGKVHPEGKEAHESGRGRSANTPSEIPAPGWKDILLRVYRGISEDRILLVGAGVTFYGLLAIFPGIAALVSIYGLFADPGSRPIISTRLPALRLAER
jgi:membrane protein